jgi:hypothetical protein
MSWEPGQSRRRNFQTAHIGDRDFWLVPKNEGSDGFQWQRQDNHIYLQRFDDPDIRDLPEYKYTGLRPDKKRIRLLKLYPGEASGTRIFCELIEAEYDKDFHIPTKIEVTSDAQKTRRTRRGRKRRTDSSSGKKYMPVKRSTKRSPGAGAIKKTTPF